ncbi:MAG TPA: hypothetical protein DEQ02_04645, partial [Ruminococcaceae bacterium]|nr:hypothetical protein [Oscillospiraceae bacterium]
NIAEVRYQSGIVEGSNPTYHRSKLLDPVPASKNAHVNSNPVDNGTVTRPVDVKRGDDITYEINVARPPAVGGSSGFQPMPKLTQPGKINFINGSFEQPEVATTPMLPEDNPWGISHTDRAYYNYTRVPGWYTVPTSPSEIGEEFWNCLQFFAGTNPVWVTYPYPDGFQSVELNAHYLSRLYQICETEPGTTVYWELYHEACQMPDGTPYSGGNLSSEDSLNVYIYATPAPGEAGDSNANRGTPPAGSRQNNNSPLVTRVDERWKKYSGSYTVPAGQESTIFAFEADASYTGNPRFGNYLDGIRLYTNSYIDLTKTNNAPSAGVNTGDIVTYTVKAKNLGESDASGVIISDILPEGTELATSEPNFLQVAAGTGAPVNMPYDYNPATRALTVPVGAGSTTTTGGLVKGDGSFSSDCQNEYTLTFKARVTDGGRDAYENQAKVVFKDRYHESEPGSSYTNYSNVSSFDARVSRHTPVTVTDIIPAGLTVTSTDPAAVVTELPGGQQQVVWTLNSIPSEGITLTVVTEVTAAGTYVNSATATMTGMRDSETNHTYHKELTLPPQAKNAHLNGAATNNGTLLAPVDVRRNDEITYDIVVDNPVDPIPQYDVLFAVDCSGTVLGAPARKVQVENLVAGLRGGIFANRPDSRIALLGMNSPSDQNGTYMPQNCTNNPSLLNLHYDTTFQTSSDYDIAQETAMTQPAQGFANDDPAQFLNAAIDKIKGLNTQFGSGTYLKTLKGRDELTSGHIPVIIFISDFEMTDGANLDYNNSGQNYWSAVMKNLSDRYASEVPNGILLTVRLDSFMGGYDFASAAADNRMMDYLSPAGRAAKGWRFTKAGGPLNALEIPTLSEVAGSLFDQATQTQRVASVTDTLPAGLTYVSHTNAAGSSSSFVSATNTVSWNWSNLPAGKTTVTVKAKVVPANNEREFVNHATVTIDGVISNTNSTYHKLSTAILNLRQMVTGFSGKTIMPYKAYFNLENDGRIFGITADSNKDTLNVPFRKVLVDFSDNDDLIYYIKNLVPQYYVSDGYVITDEYIPGDPGKAGHSAEVRDPDEPDFIIEADFGDASEYWVTVFIRAASSTAEQDWAFKTNHFGTIYPE